MYLIERLEIYRDMLYGCHGLYGWIFDRNLEHPGSNCPNQGTIDDLLMNSKTKSVLVEYCNENRRPIIMNSDNVMWTAIPIWEEGQLTNIYGMGPFLSDMMLTTDIREWLSKREIKEEELQRIIQFFRCLPVIHMDRVCEYTILLYYGIYGERLKPEDLNLYQEGKINLTGKRLWTRKNAHETFKVEQNLIRMIREGEEISWENGQKLASEVTGQVEELGVHGDSIRQMKNEVLSCVVLVSRAAAEGGLSPQIAMALSDHYFQTVQNCVNLEELSKLAGVVVNDFSRRVRECRRNRLSKPIRECCDYIDLHLEESVTMHEMAVKLRYSDVYLCRRFKAETGKTFREYVRQHKLERARHMLMDISLSVREVSEQLGFCSMSYFGKMFREEFGMTPTQWREHRYTSIKTEEPRNASGQ